MLASPAAMISPFCSTYIFLSARETRIDMTAFGLEGFFFPTLASIVFLAVDPSSGPGSFTAAGSV
jgi:hypothetical protein